MILLDTGVLVPLVNRADREHDTCAKFVGTLQARLITVEGVLVEAFCVLRQRRDLASKMLQLTAAMRVERYGVSSASIQRVGQLMTKYKRMDFVDGLLVTAAEELGISRILTLDRRDFGVYRLASGASLEILP